MTSPSRQPDPENYRMTLGEHIEELRKRLLRGLIGFAITAVVFLIFGNHVVGFFCKPLYMALKQSGVNPQIYTSEISDGFMVYLQVSMVCAVAVAGPWIIYQLWQFIAAGLYKSERKYVTKYVPLSVTLFILGLLAVYFVVLPFTLKFFIDYSINHISLPVDESPKVKDSPGDTPSYVQAIHGNPENPVDYRFWYDTSQNQLKMALGGKVRVIPFGPESLLTPIYTLPDYIDLVFRLMLTFALAFQLPLVVLAVERIGIITLPTLKRLRRVVYFGMGVAAASLTPGDVVTVMVMLMIPLIFLYEFGIFLIWLAHRQNRKEQQAAGLVPRR
jgi:sec-independent protein translocase protein TatC